MAVTLALLLDALLGEPRWLWSRLAHPAVLMGRLVGALDDRLNRGTARRAKGVLALGILVIVGAAIGSGLAALPGIWAEVIVGAMLIAQKSLVEHVRAVADALGVGLAEGRDAVGMIVGRDTGAMDAPAVAHKTIENTTKNFNNNVLTPIF